MPQRNQFAFTEDLKYVQKSKPMALIWLAATLGNKSSLKKISKKEISQLRLTQVCKQLMDPQKELALRMSSNLLIGIARVHQHQTNFLYNDCNHVLINFKKALREMQQDQALDLTISEAKMEAITLPEVELDKILDFEIREFEFKVPFPRIGSSQARSLSVAGSSPIGGAQSSDRSLMPAIDITQNLVGPSSSPFAHAGGPPSASSLEGKTSSEKSLIFADPLIQSPAFPSSSSFLGQAGQDQRLLDQHEFNFDDMGDFNIDFGNENLADINGLDVDNVDDLQFQSIGEPAIDYKSLDGGSDMAFQSLSSVPDKDVQEPSPTKTPPKRPQRKRKFHLLDEKISLSDSELMQMRQDSVINLQENLLSQWKENQHKKSLQLAKKVSTLYLDRYPTYLQPFLKTLFDESESMNSLITSDKFTGPTAESKRRRSSKGKEEYDDWEQDQLDRAAATTGGDKGYDFDYGPPSVADISAETEVGRALGSDMPWHIPQSVSASATNSSVPRSTRGRQDTVPSTPIRGRGGDLEGSDQIVFDFQGQQPGSTSDVEPLESIGFEESSLGMIGTGQDPFGFDGGEITDLETRSFFAYLMGLARESGTRILYLSDILQDQPRKTAAAAFYNVLRCAHDGYVSASQQHEDVKLQIMVNL